MLDSPLPSPPLPPHLNIPPPPSLNLDSKISPSIILIIIILAIIFFVSGLLHLVVRFLLRPNQRNPDEFSDNVTALQGQLQQLFHLHDAGVDQSYIDTLPVFQYKAIIGLKDPFDCAVCLCEFEPDDKLRLLPKCSHAFHVDCIDTWLLSHSTCPLCRASLLQDFGPPATNYPNGLSASAVVCVLESGSNTVESSRELDRVGSGLNRDEFGSNRSELVKSGETIGEEAVKKDDKIVMVKLGKFRSVEGGEGSSENILVTNNSNNNSLNYNINSNNNSVGSNDLGSRRCYSMGSFAYVMDETTSLIVPIRTPVKKPSNGRNKNKSSGGSKFAHRGAMSEYGGDSRREFNGIEAFRTLEIHENNNVGSSSSSIKKESFSFSKIWLRGVGGGEKNKKLGNMNGNYGNGNGNRNGNEIDRSSRRTTSEFEIEVSELGIDEETQSCYSVDLIANPTNSTSTRRTLMWLMGRQNNIVHNHSSSFSSNI